MTQHEQKNTRDIDEQKNLNAMLIQGIKTLKTVILF